MQITDTKSKFSWYLSGVGEIDGAMGWEWRARIPSPGQDVRHEKKTKRIADQRFSLANPPPDNVVAYKSRCVLNANAIFRLLMIDG